MKRSIVDHFDRVDRTLDTVDGYATWEEGRLNRVAETVSRWSVGQHLHHLGMVNRGIVVGIERLGASPEKRADRSLTVVGRVVLAAGRIPRGRGKAPENYVASEHIDPQRLRALNDRVRTGVASLRADVVRLEGMVGRFRHPVFGHLTAAEWIRFMGIHNDHHLRIARDVSGAVA